MPEISREVNLVKLFDPIEIKGQSCFDGFLCYILLSCIYPLNFVIFMLAACICYLFWHCKSIICLLQDRRLAWDLDLVYEKVWDDC